jgi:hypothetical protein
MQLIKQHKSYRVDRRGRSQIKRSRMSHFRLLEYASE